MKKVLVAYYSETGNTEQVARAIYDALSGVEKQIASLADEPDPTGFDLIFVGFPVIASTAPGKAEMFLKKLPCSKQFLYLMCLFLLSFYPLI